MNQVRAVTSVWLTLVCLHNTNWQTISSLTCFTTYHMTPVITWDDNIHTTLWGEHTHWPMNHMAFPVVGEERVLRVGTKRLVVPSKCQHHRKETGLCTFQEEYSHRDMFARQSAEHDCIPFNHKLRILLTTLGKQLGRLWPMAKDHKSNWS